MKRRKFLQILGLTAAAPKVVAEIVQATKDGKPLFSMTHPSPGRAMLKAEGESIAYDVGDIVVAHDGLQYRAISNGGSMVARQLQEFAMKQLSRM